MPKTPKSSFYAPMTEQNARPMTFEKDRKIEGWGDAPAEHQSRERAMKQHAHMASDPKRTISPKK